MLTCSALVVNVAGRSLVRDLTFHLAPGEVIGVLGPNGVGKTLTLHTLAGLRLPGHGSVLLGGDALGHLQRRQVAQRLGLLLQDDAETFPATVLETTLMGRHPHRFGTGTESADDLARARTALAAMGLEAFEARLVSTLSGGERRRLSLARLLTQDPGVLLLDEPVNHLDPRHQIRVLRHIGALARAGRGVIMTLHDPTLALRFASHALLLFPGGTWLLDTARAALTPGNLERLFSTPWEKYLNDRGDVALFPGNLPTAALDDPEPGS
ncbi:MAG: ABC transporter ATP-binding protein [Chromatiales bacterium]|nr:ABC transporter ATP-binding protein [Chromatiales bacterium]